MTNESETTEKDFFAKLFDGDFGLAKTYWVYGVLVSQFVNTVILSIALAILYTALNGSPFFTMLAYLACLPYIGFYIPVFIGVWHSANKYEGSKAWAILAKIAVVLGAIPLVSYLSRLSQIVRLLGQA